MADFRDRLPVFLRDDGTFMSTSSNGVSHTGDGPAGQSGSSSRCPRRLVLLKGDDQSEVAQVLVEYRDAEVSGKRLHAEVQRQALEHLGQCVAAEWLGPLGWTRFLWCRRPG
jgi:hypothetical protein